MGCDIHFYIEKQNKSGKWEHYREIHPDYYPNERNYDLFQLLAGVRGDTNIESHFPDRGIPKDTSYKQEDPNKYDRIWLGDHSFTYATIWELKKVKFSKHLNYGHSDYDHTLCEFEYFLHYNFPGMCNSYKKIRMLIGFDS